MSVIIDGNGRISGLLLPALGECRLELIGGLLVLKRHKGRLLTINGRYEEIPAQEPTLSPIGTPASTPLNIYAYMDVTNAMQLEWSTAAWAVDANTGVRIKTGDATRTLVGRAACATAGVWVDTDTYRYVRSWFNPKGRKGIGSYAQQRNLGAPYTTWTELDQALRINWIAFEGDIADLKIAGACLNGTVGAVMASAVALNSPTIPQHSVTSTAPAGNYWMPVSVGNPFESADGLNYMTGLSWVNAGTGSWSLTSSVNLAA